MVYTKVFQRLTMQCIDGNFAQGHASRTPVNTDAGVSLQDYLYFDHDSDLPKNQSDSAHAY